MGGLRGDCGCVGWGCVLVGGPFCGGRVEGLLERCEGGIVWCGGFVLWER